MLLVLAAVSFAFVACDGKKGPEAPAVDSTTVVTETAPVVDTATVKVDSAAVKADSAAVKKAEPKK